MGMLELTIRRLEFLEHEREEIFKLMDHNFKGMQARMEIFFSYLEIKILLLKAQFLGKSLGLRRMSICRVCSM